MAGLKLKSGSSGLENLSAGGKAVIGVIFLGMVAAAYFVVFYSDVSESITAEQQTLVQKKKELEDAKEAQKAYNKDVAEKARKEALQRKQEKILPNTAESPAFLAAVQTMATISGIKLTSWTPLDESPEAFYAKVPMQLKLSGKFHQLTKFFNGIGQVDRIINMENIVIKVNDKRQKRFTPQELAAGAEEPVTVDAECLATAFRASTTSKRTKDKKGKKGTTTKRSKK
jgi:type IV pilus assembly protein PilO